MVKKGLALLVGVAVLGVALGVFGLFWPALVEAQTPAALRSLSPAMVAPGGEVTVTIDLTDVPEGRVEETLPSGFSYVANSVNPGDILVRPRGGGVYRFIVRNVDQFSYKVTVSNTPDDYTFSGVVTAVYGGGDSAETADVMGDSMVTVGMATETLETPETPVTPETMDPTATRATSPATVTAGGQFTVTVNVSNLGSGGGRVEETLPSGSSYVMGSVSPADIRVTTQGQTVRFTIRGTNRFTYMVNAPSQPGDYSIMGVLRDDERNSYAMADSAVTVQSSAMPTGPAASRSLSAMSAAPGGELTVTVNVSGLGSAGGRVEETLPAGFSYVMDSVSPTDIRVTERGQTVRFTIRGTNQFSYKVMTTDVDGSYSIMGVLRDDQRMTHTVTGDSAVTVGAVANRSLSATTVRPGAGMTVTITAGGYDSAGARIEETLPSGFSYVDGSVSEDDIRVTERDQTVRFTIRGTESFTYGVRASNAPGTYPFTGILRDADQTTHTVGGDNSVTVQAPPATIAPKPTRRPSSRGGGGGGGGGGYAPLPIATPTPMPTRAPVATIAPTPTQIIVPTIVAPTAAPTPEPEPTAVPPTAVPTPRPTAVVVVPTLAPTKAAEPTAMPKPTAVPATAVPPTEVPPTAMVEPTEPPAPTATIAPTVAPVTPVTPTDDGMPTWLIILIIVIIVAVVIAAVGFYMMRMRR